MRLEKCEIILYKVINIQSPTEKIIILLTYDIVYYNIISTLGTKYVGYYIRPKNTFLRNGEKTVYQVVRI